MKARAGNSILDFETLFSDFQELLNGSGLRPKLNEDFWNLKLQLVLGYFSEPVRVWLMAELI